VRSLEEEEAYLNLIRIRTEGLVEAPYLFHRALQQSPELVEEALQLAARAAGEPGGLPPPAAGAAAVEQPSPPSATSTADPGSPRRPRPPHSRHQRASHRSAHPGRPLRFHSIKGAGHVYGTDAPGEAAGVVVSFIESQVKRRSGQAAGRLQASGRHG
jgi:hypothetical protein